MCGMERKAPKAPSKLGTCHTRVMTESSTESRTDGQPEAIQTEAARVPVTLITGATGDIGWAIAQALPEHQLILLGRSPQKLQLLATQCTQKSLQAHCLGLETGDIAELETVLAPFPEVDHVVHCAGSIQLDRIAQAQASDWHRMYQDNVIFPMLLTQVLLPRLRARQGSVVFINSGAGLHAGASWGGYAASKFALKALAESLRNEEPTLRVASVYPGRVASTMQQQVRQQEGASYQAERYLSPEDVASSVRQILTMPAHVVLQDVVLRPKVVL